MQKIEVDPRKVIDYQVKKVKGGTTLSTIERITNTHKQGSSDSDKFRYHHYHNFGKVIKNEHVPKKLKKAKPPTFDGELKPTKYIETWFLGMKEALQSPQLL